MRTHTTTGIAGCARRVRKLSLQQLSASSGWSAVAEVEPPAQSAALTVEVGAFRVAVSAETDEKLLARTLKTLVTLC